MTSRRVLKAAEAVREVVSTAILMDLQDPRIQNVTVIRVEVSGDMRAAKVHVSIMGDEAAQNLSLHGLRSAAGYLQSKVAKRIDTRYTPRLSFELDKGVKHSLEVDRILRDVLPKPVDEEAEELAAEALLEAQESDADGFTPTDPSESPSEENPSRETE